MLGPFNSHEEQTFPGTSKRVFFQDRSVYRDANWPAVLAGQRDPIPLPYLLYRVVVRPFPYGRLGGQPSTDAPNSRCGDTVARGSPSRDDGAINRALQDLSSSISSYRAGIGENIAQGRQGLEMIAARASQLARVAKAARTMNVRNVVRSLRPNQRGRTLPLLQDILSDAGLPSDQKSARRLLQKPHKSASDLFLEYAFGWRPLVTDIYQASQLLGNSLPSGRVTGYGSARGRIWDRQGSNPPQKGQTYFFSEAPYRSSCKITADVTVDNAATFWGNFLGIDNPAAVAWAVVPWSFVVDWFFDIGGLLESYSALNGVSFTNASYTLRRSASGVEYYLYTDYTGKTYLDYGQETQAYRHQRILGLPAYRMPTLEFTTPSVWRAATQIALLLQQLDGLQQTRKSWFR